MNKYFLRIVSCLSLALLIGGCKSSGTQQTLIIGESVKQTPLLVVDTSNLAPEDFTQETHEESAPGRYQRIDEVRVNRPVKVILVPIGEVEAKMIMESRLRRE